MIVVDSSCVLAILQNEPEKDAFRAVLAGGNRCLMSAVNVHEALWSSCEADTALRAQRGFGI
jgi:uncharacterized protein with PIN domain